MINTANDSEKTAEQIKEGLTISEVLITKLPGEVGKILEIDGEVDEADLVMAIDNALEGTDLDSFDVTDGDLDKVIAEQESLLEISPETQYRTAEKIKKIEALKPLLADLKALRSITGGYPKK